MADVAALLAAYDDQVRPSEARNLPAGAYAEADGPIVRVVGLYQGFISAPAELTLGGDELDALIARQREFFAGRGEAVEWKTRAHDRPEDLPVRLRAAGFVPEPTETVLIGLAGPQAERQAPSPPGGEHPVDGRAGRHAAGGRHGIRGLSGGLGLDGR
jgi:hypothetical protein